jgi:hypothetical protein
MIVVAPVGENGEHWFALPLFPSPWRGLRHRVDRFAATIAVRTHCLKLVANHNGFGEH